MISTIPNLRARLCLAFVCVFFGAFITNAQTTQTFNNNNTFTVPPNITSITVECWGGGGGGGGTNSNNTAAGGGGGGSYASSVLSVTPGQTYTVTIGAAGASGAATSGAGGAGGTTWFGTATTIAAPGGTGGTGGALGAGGAGGTGGIGTIIFNGGSGAAGVSNASGGGGGSAGSTMNGGDASGNTGGAAGTVGGAAGANGKTAQGNGTAGTAPGSGGSGGYRSTSGNRTGGAGAKGRVKVTYTFPACNGVPDHVTISGPGGVCPGVSFTLNATIPPLGFAGITYDWQSNDGSGWQSLGTSTASLTVSSGISIPTSYRFVSSCTNTNQADTSNVAAVAINPPNQCYCSSLFEFASDGFEYITNVTYAGINNTTGITASGDVADYTAQVGNVIPGLSNTISISIGGTDFDDDNVYVYIDWNQNGILGESGEQYTVATAVNTDGPVTSTITPPLDAVPGNTRMRVQVIAFEADPDPCVDDFYGESEDYTLNVATLTTCSGQPAPVTISGISTICPNTGFTLSAAGMTAGTGITYDWQSNDGSGWVSTGGNTTTYTSAGIAAPTQFRFVTTCTNSGNKDSSNVLSVALNPAPFCLCTVTTASAADEYISNISAGTFSNTTSANYYTNYTGLSPLGTATAGATFDITFTATNHYAEDQLYIYMDQNQDGILTAADMIGSYTAFSGTGSGSETHTVSCAIPSTALAGLTSVRIMMGDATNGDTYGPLTAEPCANFNYGEIEDYKINVFVPTCFPPSNLGATNITTSSADLTWDAPSSGVPLGYEYVVDLSANDPAGAGTPVSIPGGSVSTLSGSSTYYLHVRTNCGSGDFSSWVTTSFQTPLGNDLPGGAVTLVVGAGCTGATYSNVGASFNTGEPMISCNGSQTTASTVWFKFQAPASGIVRASTDVAGNGLTNTRMALFTTSNPGDPNDLAAYSIISCDENNGTVIGNAATLYASGLISGNTYYVAVDGSTGNTGTFCLTIDEVTNSMIAPTGSCTQSPTGQRPAPNTTYTGWTSLTDNSGRLIANVRRNTAGTTGTGTFAPYLTVNTGAERQTGGTYYLDRNFRITYNNADVTTFDVQFFFLNTELSALQGVDPNAALSNLNVTRQTGESGCNQDVVAGEGTFSLLSQTANGTAPNGFSWIQVTTPGFSNFYISNSITPLYIKVSEISATNVGNKNRIDWNTATEAKGDYFTVERSLDGIHYKEIGTVSAKGTASEYTYWDALPANGVNYYRLKLTDIAGNNGYTKVVTAEVKGSRNFNVEAYPNPASNQVSLKVFGVQGENPGIIVSDLTGKVISNAHFNGDATTINMSGLAQGVYLIKYVDSNNSQTIKITKQ
ncbi:T9SS type A sorting domain-containing protein [Taibaiella lutea]|uniref:T9SS type A sorting domain-containing protein n=1 Tax=Taibaiella lutea TaxID=2608001 RepID=A0A5M6CGZ9_9BACT|nr:GEVED domain-containing protein [Taibaiella lutea]KAA5534508.1 T9SS type A sorting domain-containing protein [Taibaiella lutea]